MKAAIGSKKPSTPRPFATTAREIVPPSRAATNTTNEALGRRRTPCVGQSLVAKLTTTRKRRPTAIEMAMSRAEILLLLVSMMGTDLTPAIRALDANTGSAFVVRTEMVMESPGLSNIGMIFSFPSSVASDGVMSMGCLLVMLVVTISALFAGLISIGDSKSPAAIGRAPSLTSSRTVRYGACRSDPPKEIFKSRPFAVSGGCNEVWDSFLKCTDLASSSARHSHTGTSTPAKVAVSTTQNFQSNRIAMAGLSIVGPGSKCRAVEGEWLVVRGTVP